MKKLILITFLATPMFADENDPICKEFLTFEAELNKTLPQKTDEVTEATQFSVNCDTNTVKYTKRIVVDLTFKDGWKERKQRQHNQLHCNANGISSLFGWRVMDVLYDSNFKYLATFITEPKDCENNN